MATSRRGSPAARRSARFPPEGLHGQATVEYALIVAMFAVITIGLLWLMKDPLQLLFAETLSAIGGRSLVLFVF